MVEASVVGMCRESSVTAALSGDGLQASWLCGLRKCLFLELGKFCSNTGLVRLDFFECRWCCMLLGNRSLFRLGSTLKGTSASSETLIQGFAVSHLFAGVLKSLLQRSTYFSKEFDIVG